MLKPDIFNKNKKKKVMKSGKKCEKIVFVKPKSTVFILFWQLVAWNLGIKSDWFEIFSEKKTIEKFEKDIKLPQNF